MHALHKEPNENCSWKLLKIVPKPQNQQAPFHTLSRIVFSRGKEIKIVCYIFIKTEAALN